MNRRKFLKQSCSACLAVAAMPLILDSCLAISNSTGRLTDKGLVLRADDFLLKDSKGSAYRASLIVRNDKLKYPICVYRTSDKDYNAIWMQCSHQGAELQAAGDQLHCPAHGSEFNKKGVVTAGPADVNLRTFPVTVNGNEIFIDLQKQS